jgi:hypothetical protein
MGCSSDAATPAASDPGRVTIHRLNRVEFEEDDPRRTIAERRLAELSLRVGRVTLIPAPEATVEMEAENLQTESPMPLNTMIAVSPGPQRIEVSAPNHESHQYTPNLAAGAELVLTVLPGPPIVAAVPEKDSKPTSTRKARATGRSEVLPDQDAKGARTTWGVAALSVGGAALAVSGVAALLVLREKGIMDQECIGNGQGGSACPPRGVRASRRGRLYSSIGTVGFAVGSAASGVAAYLFLSDESTVSGRVDSSGAQVSVSGRF